ncbi:hypothetical protein HZB00_03515 [Candidatus Woesearchaeota archaeon]|nr:hypothetical protein [Candidatus Woesearchaeota archaeon]
MSREDFREFQFGCLYISTNGVWRPTHERLYPKEMLREEKDEKVPKGDVVTGEHLRFALTGEVTAAYDKISRIEVRARMARTRMADADEIPSYEETRGYFADLKAADAVRKNLFYLLADRRDDIFNVLNFYVLDPDEEGWQVQSHSYIVSAGRDHQFSLRIL